MGWREEGGKEGLLREEVGGSEGQGRAQLRVLIRSKVNKHQLVERRRDDLPCPALSKPGPGLCISPLPFMHSVSGCTRLFTCMEPSRRSLGASKSLPGCGAEAHGWCGEGSAGVL